jgi:hypothetical protein
VVSSCYRGSNLFGWRRGYFGWRPTRWRKKTSNFHDLSSDCSVFKNNVSFLRLNVHSIVPKLDIITAEYSSYDILSFTESWLKPNINDETLKLPGYKFPHSDETDKIRREVELLSMLRNTLIVLSDLTYKWIT